MMSAGKIVQIKVKPLITHPAKKKKTLPLIRKIVRILANLIH